MFTTKSNRGANEKCVRVLEAGHLWRTLRGVLFFHITILTLAQSFSI